MAELMKSANGVLFWDVSFFKGVNAQELEPLSGFMVKNYYSILMGSNDYCFP